jgi:hypothetical protein
MPERPAIAGGQALHQRADLVNRAGDRADRKRAIGPHHRGVPVPVIDQDFASNTSPASTIAANGMRSSERLSATAAMAPGGSGSTPAILALAARTKLASRSMPMKERPSLLATAPVSLMSFRFLPPPCRASERLGQQPRAFDANRWVMAFRRAAGGAIFRSAWKQSRGGDNGGRHLASQRPKFFPLQLLIRVPLPVQRSSYPRQL